MPELYEVDWTPEEKKWAKDLQKLCNRVPDTLCLFGTGSLYVLRKSEDTGDEWIGEIGVMIVGIACGGGTGAPL